MSLKSFGSEYPTYGLNLFFCISCKSDISIVSVISNNSLSPMLENFNNFSEVEYPN